MKLGTHEHVREKNRHKHLGHNASDRGMEQSNAMTKHHGECLLSQVHLCHYMKHLGNKFMRAWSQPSIMFLNFPSKHTGKLLTSRD